MVRRAARLDHSFGNLGTARLMQIDELVLYSRDGDSRPITFRAGRLNIITGDSRTGKSSLINIIRFLLGGGSPHAPYGPIQQTVVWYGMRAHVGDTSFFIAREAPPGDRESGAAMLTVGATAAPPLRNLKANTSSSALRDYLGGIIGIEDNRNVPPLGQTRRALSAGFVHSLFYCFQGQGEIANPDILFHRQNREWIPQTIRDTLPYFLGAQGAEDLRRREELIERRRDLRRLNQRLRAAESERSAGLDRASALLTESLDVGLIAERPQVGSLDEARQALFQILSNTTVLDRIIEDGGEFDRLGARRRELTARVRDLGEQARALEEFADADQGLARELREQNARLASIQLVPEDTREAQCALCDQPLGEADSSSWRATDRALGRASRRVDLARRDIPRIEQVRAELREQQRAARDQIRDIDQALEDLARRDELVAQTRELINVQSYVRGRIALYLDASQDVSDVELQQLHAEIGAANQAIERLTELLDTAAVRSRTTSALRTIAAK